MIRRTPPGPKQAAPVNWYAPGQLVRTGIEVLTSDVFGKRADSRRLSAFGPKDPPFDPPQLDAPGCAREQDLDGRGSAGDQGQQKLPLWIDFAADCGDGFAATFSVASALAAAVTVTGPDGRTLRLEAGRVLILGGDQVYPTPNWESYEGRFVTPYRHAVAAHEAEQDPRTVPERHLYAVPGNHDWYDGLVEFSRVFCTQSKIGPWQTRQHRSYFALRLSPLLWLLAVDTQICQDIDRDQLEYFRAILRAWKAGSETPAQVIVVTAEPHWEAVRYDGTRDPPLQRVDICALGTRHLLGTLLCELEQQHARVVLQLTGDLHHYRRYTSGDHCHLITAGGGGAFLHPTHTRVEADPLRQIGTEQRRYIWQGADFPDLRSSRALAWHNLRFARDNPQFLPLLGAVYLLLGLVMPVPKSPGLLGLPGEALMNLVVHTQSAFVFLAVTGAVIAFTDTANRRYKWVAGTLHALAHLTAALLLTWLFRGLRVELARSETVELHHVWRHLGFGASMVALGGVVGASIWGAYLLVSVNGFKRHSNEAFSSLGIEDYKCFVRMKLDGDQLTVYPLGLRETPRAWRWQEQDRTWTATPPPRWELIEAPISIPLLKAGAPLPEATLGL